MLVKVPYNKTSGDNNCCAANASMGFFLVAFYIAPC
jgi:hypothetical protein